VLAAQAAIGLGTPSGGRRIIYTMGPRIAKLQPVHGFAAETGAAAAVRWGFAGQMVRPGDLRFPAPR
jgi:phosphate/sulfate permease